MKIAKYAMALALGLGLHAMNAAIAAPQTGTWLIGNNQNAYGGDIINIDAQNNKVFIIFAAGAVPNDTYFLFGTGTISNNDIAVDLVSTKDSSTKHVTGTFDTSVTGTLNFPGVGQRSIYRVKLNDESKPESMLGAWNFSYSNTTSGTGTSQIRVFNSTAAGSSTGTGMAVDSTNTFGCEYQSSGSAAGLMVCVDTSSSVTRGFVMRRNANEAGGYYVVGSSSNYIGLAQRLIASDNSTVLLLKSASTRQPALAAAMESFVRTNGAAAAKALAQQQ